MWTVYGGVLNFNEVIKMELLFFSNPFSHAPSNSPVLLPTSVLLAHSIANQSLVIISITPINQANISADCGNYLLPVFKISRPIVMGSWSEEGTWFDSAITSPLSLFQVWLLWPHKGSEEKQ